MRPDYSNSIVNLMSSIARALGGTMPYPQLRQLPAKELRRTKRTVLLVVDGLGYEWLRAHGKGSFLERHLQSKMTSVFPSTTAAAMTTFFTGVAPQQHAFTGWNMLFKELGMVVAPLPPWTRSGHLPVPQFDVEGLTNARPFFEIIRTKSAQVIPKGYLGANYNDYLIRAARLYPYRTLNGFSRQVRKAARERRFVLAYWPLFDKSCHQTGTDSSETLARFREIDRAVRGIAAGLHDTTLIVTADHGFMDCSPKRTILLDHHPELLSALTVPLCGESRAAYAYVRPARTKAFERYVKRHLAHACTLMRSEELVSDGWYGRGKEDPRLRDRIGDYVLVMKDGWVVQDPVMGETHSGHIGRHGGVSKKEMLVPLIVVKN